MEAAPSCFGLQRNHHQGATASAQLKLQDWLNFDIDVVQKLSVLCRHSMTCMACVLCTVQAHCACTVHNTQATTAIALTTSARRL